MSRSNPLVTAFQANADWSALYDAKLAELQASLIDGGALATSRRKLDGNAFESGASIWSRLATIYLGRGGDTWQQYD